MPGAVFGATASQLGCPTGAGDDGGGLLVLPLVAVVALVVLGAGAYLVFGRGDAGPGDGIVD